MRRNGAAPNSPAKLLGLKRSPKTEKRETAIPPIRKRMGMTFIRRSQPARFFLFPPRKLAHYRRLFLTSFKACPGPLIRSTLNFLPFSLLYVMKNCSISLSMLLFRSSRLFTSE